MRSDPFAPANHPLHPKNVRAAIAEDVLTRGDGKHERNRFAELLEVHLTPHEQQANVLPSIEEAERRQTLVDEFREQLATEGPDAELPTLEDGSGALYQWHEGDHVADDPDDPDGQPNGTTSSGWRYIGEDDADTIDVPPRNGPGSDTDTWRMFAATVTRTELAQWSTLSRTEIIASLERDSLIPNEQA